MCGRFTLTASPEEIKKHFNYSQTPNFPARYNIAPTQPVAVICDGQGKVDFQLMRWGFLPSWVKDPSDFPLLINARSETILEKPSFKGAIKYRRCLVPANGFYEWLRDDKHKYPYYAQSTSGILSFAAIWEHWMDSEGSEIDSLALITTDANATLSAIHHRMPVVIQPQDYATWLNHDHTNLNNALALLKTPADEQFDVFPVSQKVNNARNDEAGLMEKLQKQPIAKPKEGGSKDKPDNDQFNLL